MPVDPEVAHLRARVAANARWARAGARKQQSDTISDARIAHHERKVDPDQVLDPKERRRLAENSLQAEMAALSLKAVRARRQQRKEADRAKAS